ncbi:glycine/sarcosine/betaine reductase complex component C subunit alpha [Clostridium sp. CX1]|uniref:Glycine/sarcosine/betaine reductase complex component C subunit alpha n=1 Tax=Clostridium tanneri TaxID=3037988 RepID=A0ABU4JRG2_9CLOT|nr:MULTISPECIES: glycine/sarcosine/betaine reductase complex component C subunit alpha [unclassified Clostridium]MCT8975891.1 glycine/sarcosine/betaine reductase complex component C subunit alpha [Clostridium sp. CX1]MDW8800747.1 glycine/sarcosine/betaine reductase complex component C subunit alpha [Clostridium sp. A1-XYC3]
MDATKKLISEVFNEIADGIKSGSFGKKVRIGLTTFGSEHGVEEMVKAAQMAKSKYGDFDIVLIGPKVEGDFEVVEVKDAEEGHKKMVELLENKELDGCVTQHFDFPIGVSTVGRVVTPGMGKELIIATTTGTTSTHRVEGMIRNAISGIAVAKSVGIENPEVGILNIDGARGVERALKDLQAGGYNFKFSESLRADGGSVMRGNDLLAGTPDVMVCDSLTGNLLIKIFASFTTGGNYETLGYGYGPGIGENYDKLVNIVSRASGAPLICEALRYCATCAKNDVLAKAKEEFKKAKESGLDTIVGKILAKDKPAAAEEEEVKMPPKQVVTYAIPGIDILELENACKALWKEGIYSESGMGCTGPIILVPEEVGEKAAEILTNKGFK